MTRKVLSVFVAALMLLSCFALIAYADDPAGNVYISVEDFGDRDYLLDYCDEEEMCYPDQFGVIADVTEVPFYAGESVAEAIVRFFGMKDIAYTASGDAELNGGFFLKNISFDFNGERIENFGEGSITPDDEYMFYFSGWMITLNNWFTSSGISSYEAEDGDIVRIQYTCGMGADIGSDYSVRSAAITGIVIDESYGAVAPAFSTETKAYTLTVGEDVEAVKLAVTNDNYSSVVTYTADGTEYKYMRDIPVADGTVITVNSKYYASDYPDYIPYLADEDEITITVVKPASEPDSTEPATEPAAEGDTSIASRISAFFNSILNFFRNLFQRIADFFSGLFN